MRSSSLHNASPAATATTGPNEENQQQMSKATVGKVVPALKLPATGDQTIDLKTLRGKKVVMYFYPKDSTPGCTTEGQDFAANHAKFKRNNTLILGVSRDSVASHEKFGAKHNFPFDLLSDKDEKACGIFDVIKEKNMYGRKVMGIERSTFLIDEKGKLRNEWRKVKVKGHVDEVLLASKAL
jgi:peroxiredoxin Q/BCP